MKRICSSADGCSADETTVEEAGLTEPSDDNRSPDMGGSDQDGPDLEDHAKIIFGQPSDHQKHVTTSNKIFNPETLELVKTVSHDDETRRITHGSARSLARRTGRSFCRTIRRAIAAS